MARFGITRRRFLYAAGGMAAAAAGGAGLYCGTQKAVPIGVIGLGLRGMVLAGTLARRWYRVYGDIRAVCDVDLSHAEEAKHKFARGAAVYQDYRRVLEREDLAAVVIATPD